MAHYGDKYGTQTDEYGNPIRHPATGGDDLFGATGGTEPYMNQPGATGPTGAYGIQGGGTTGAYGTHAGGTTGTTGAFGTHGGTTGTTGAHGGGIAHGLAAAVGGGHRRSGSSSSSSSEDDGLGGRRKKGLKDKIKEKLPGGRKDEQYGTTAGGGGYGYDQAGTTTGGGGGYGYEQAGHQQPEKKGMMEKIKEKLPGHH